MFVNKTDILVYKLCPLDLSKHVSHERTYTQARVYIYTTSMNFSIEVNPSRGAGRWHRRSVAKKVRLCGRDRCQLMRRRGTALVSDFSSVSNRNLHFIRAADGRSFRGRNLHFIWRKRFGEEAAYLISFHLITMLIHFKNKYLDRYVRVDTFE